MWHRHETLRLRSEMRVHVTLINSLRDNPQSCPLIYQRIPLKKRFRLKWHNYFFESYCNCWYDVMMMSNDHWNVLRLFLDLVFYIFLKHIIYLDAAHWNVM